MFEKRQNSEPCVWCTIESVNTHTEIIPLITTAAAAAQQTECALSTEKSMSRKVILQWNVCGNLAIKNMNASPARIHLTTHDECDWKRRQRQVYDTVKINNMSEYHTSSCVSWRFRTKKTTWMANCVRFSSTFLFCISTIEEKKMVIYSKSDHLLRARFLNFSLRSIKWSVYGFWAATAFFGTKWNDRKHENNNKKTRCFLLLSFVCARARECTAFAANTDWKLLQYLQ